MISRIVVADDDPLARMVRDVIVDHVSFIDNDRAHFKHLLATASYSPFIASMRAKTTDNMVNVRTSESAVTVRFTRKRAWRNIYRATLDVDHSLEPS